MKSARHRSQIVHRQSLKDGKIDRYNVKSKEGVIGEMSNDFIHIKLGNKHIKSYIMTLND